MLYIHKYVCVVYCNCMFVYIQRQYMRGDMAWLGLGCSAGRQLTVSALHNQLQISKGGLRRQMARKVRKTDADGVGQMFWGVGSRSCC